MTTYIYARVSTEDQSLDSQLLETKTLYPTAIVYAEHASGKDMDRVELQKMLNVLSSGDTVVVHRLDRISRSLSDFTRLLEDFKNGGITFVSVHDAIDTGTTTGRLLAGLLGSINQYFRELTSDRVKEGLKAAKKRGVKLGNPRSLGRKSLFGDADAERMAELSKTCSLSAIARSYNISRTTVYRLIEKFNRKKMENTFEMSDCIVCCEPSVVEAEQASNIKSIGDLDV